MSETVWLALLALVSGTVTALIAPIAILIITSRTRRREKREEWQHQLEVDNFRLATAAKTDRKLDNIHSLVNNSFTEAKRSELSALKKQYSLTVELNGLREPTSEQKIELAALIIRIGELENLVAERAQRDLATAAS